MRVQEGCCSGLNSQVCKGVGRANGLDSMFAQILHASLSPWILESYTLMTLMQSKQLKSLNSKLAM